MSSDRSAAATGAVGCRVLLVDDSRDFLASVERFLAAEPGIAVVGRAYSGREALEQVARLRPHVVLMDLAMPEMTGLEATRHLKTDPEAPRVIILTMYEDEAFREAAHDMGADGFVPKSRLGTELVPLVHQFQ